MITKPKGKTVKSKLGKEKLKLFTMKQFEYLHKIFLHEEQNSKTGESILKKNGLDLKENEINFVKECFDKYEEN